MFAAGVAVVGGLVFGRSGEQRASSLKVGDCFNDTAEMFSGEEILRVPSVSCSEPHAFYMDLIQLARSIRGSGL
jgi:hypothetical protein